LKFVGLIDAVYWNDLHFDVVAVQQEANCSFDEGLCSFVQDFSRTVPWKRVPEDAKTIDIPVSMRPIFDHTTMSR